MAVLHQAERAFQDQSHRDDIRKSARYFAAIVRRLNEEHQRRLRRQAVNRELLEEQQRWRFERMARLTYWLAHPTAWLEEALKAVAAQWLADERRLSFEGRGIGSGWMRGALDRLREVLGPQAAVDAAHGAMAAFRLTHREKLGEQCIDAIAAVLESSLQSGASFVAPSPSAMLALAGNNRRPPPADRLRN